tara:strand:- start:2137 stop:3933 length:1797 start_codon:yes stop_codon:yes gene_type:complete
MVLSFQLGLIWFFLLIYRFCFLIQNKVFFPDFGLYEYLVGCWFDLITISLFLFPFIIFSTIPLPQIINKYRRILDWVLFVPPVIVIFFFNSWDIAYFSFARKRISYDYFKFIISENEASVLAGDFISEFWWLILVFILTLLIVFYFFFKLKQEYSDPKDWRSWSKFVLTAGLFLVIGRGGFQLRPVGVLEATNYCSLQNSPAVLNSAFTILKTYDSEGLERKTYFKKENLNALFNPFQRSNPSGFLPDKTNVVFVLFESYGSMYVGPNNPESYTPFLDSILKESMYFEYGVANSRTSMDGLPSVVASIPSWMNESFILSSYGMNQFQSLPSILKKRGYSSAFFHGATNGSMRFDAFTAAAGFDRYFGRSEYPVSSHYDGHWGIPDHYFMPWSVVEINKLSEPFFTMIFTISSHHPYQIPKDFQSKVKQGPDPICKAISYSDYAFHEFWKKAKGQEWFENTLFIFCADHVGPTGRKDRSNLEWSFKIPIAYYHPKQELPKVAANISTQQIDIMPTVLDLLNIETDFFAMGTSYFSNFELPKVVYQGGNLIALSANEKPLIWNDLMSSKWSLEDIKRINQLKAIYQHYTNALIDNRMIAE